VLDGIPAAPRGVPQIEVKFDIDANGILNVSAKDKTSGREQKITIQGSTGLSDDEIDKMVKDAEIHKAEDEKKKVLVEAKNVAENMTYTAEKTLADAKDKVEASKKEEVEKMITELRELIKTSQDVEVLKAKTDELSKHIQEIGASMYKDAQAETPEAKGEGTESKPEDKKDGSETEGEVVEGEVEE